MRLAYRILIAGIRETLFDAMKGEILFGDPGQAKVEGDREIHPAPPVGAKTLTLSVGTPLLDWDGQPRPSQVVERLIIDLRSEKVSPSEHPDGGAETEVW